MPQSDLEISYWLRAQSLPQVGPQTFQRWLRHFGSIDVLFQAENAELAQAGISSELIHAIKNPDLRALDMEFAWLKKKGDHHLLTLKDEAYPPRLAAIHSAPLVLRVWGNLAALKNPQLAMVGSRHPTSSGENTAKEFAMQLVQSGFTITSGLALGIDAASHRGALALQGTTLGVAGTGLNYIYPACHKPLVHEIIANGGALISEFSLNERPKPHHFPQRNRIIAGLSLGVLVIEAALKSGSLITAKYALEEGREVFAIPGSIHQTMARGCNHLIRQGAKLVETAQDVLEELSAYAIFPSVQKVKCDSLKEDQAHPVREPLSKDHQNLLEKIDYAVTAVDSIILRSGLTAGEVSSMLLILELQGHIQAVSGGYVRTNALSK